jgi:hypothetical protein
MQDFETTTDDADSENTNEERTPLGERVRQIAKVITRRFVLLLSFGPGILGFLWLLGRILKR